MDTVEKPTVCPYCDGRVIYTTNDMIYGKQYGDWPYVYMCVECQASVGVHPNTDEPLGYLADKRLKTLRKDCKAWFEKVWRSGILSRTEAYKWLATEMGMDRRNCHWGMFNADQCMEARRHCMNLLGYKPFDVSKYDFEGVDPDAVDQLKLNIENHKARYKGFKHIQEYIDCIREMEPKNQRWAVNKPVSTWMKRARMKSKETDGG